MVYGPGLKALWFMVSGASGFQGLGCWGSGQLRLQALFRGGLLLRLPESPNTPLMKDNIP